MSDLQTIARPYAKALFELAEGEKQQARWQAFLDAAAEMVIHPEIEQNLKNPAFLAEWLNWLDHWMNGTDEQERQLIYLLDHNNRLLALPAIAQGFSHLCAQSHNSIDVHIKSAQALSEDDLKQLSEAMMRKLGKSANLSYEVDPSLLAGVVIQYDGQVIDQSIKGRLEKFARELDE